VLYDTHYGALTRLAALLVDDVAAAEEVTQAAFAALHDAWPRLCDGDRAVSYLLQKIVSHARSYRAVGQRAMPQAGQGAITAAGPVLMAFRTLPARQREVLVLRYYVGLGDGQIASVMGTGLRSVRGHIKRGMTSLRPVLERQAVFATRRRAGDVGPKGRGA
jgi:DNA-directed RNA polymerase specialized sigma24 family protein